MTFPIFNSGKNDGQRFVLQNVPTGALCEILKHSVLTILFLTASVSSQAQQTIPAGTPSNGFSMQELIGQSLSKLRQPTPESFLNCIAEMKRIDAMFPDSLQPKFQMALQSLYYSVTNPHATQTENLLEETEQIITKMEEMTNKRGSKSHRTRKNGPIAVNENRVNNDLSDVCTLRGFLYMVLIVQNPARNGQRYYIDVMQNYEKALKLNPDNQLAKQLQQKFFEGMRKQTGEAGPEKEH